jgi:hypothetical protein
MRISGFSAGSVVSILALALCGASVQAEEAANAGNPLVGAWEMQQVHWKSDEKNYSIEKAQPGLFIFSDKRYSIMWAPGEEPRTPFKVLSKPTDEEAIAGFKSVVFNGGSYVHDGSTVTTTAAIAKVPGFEGGKQFYRYNIEGDTLHLTMFDETYPDGKKPEWSGKFVTEFVLKRAD